MRRMRIRRLLLGLALVLFLGGLAHVAQQGEPAGSKMTAAAQKFLDSLTPEQRTKATLAFDDKERFNWRFTPRQDGARKSTRKGLSLEEMSADQKRLALDLTKTGTSARGAETTTTIMSLESILHELEKGGRAVRNPDWYFFAVFGAPSKTAKWGWRVEGHHLALNFTLDGGKVVGSTPAFFGANPATVKAGPRAGLRTLPEIEDLARELFRDLDESQRKIAHQAGNFPEIKEGTSESGIGEPKGLRVSQMNDRQRATLMKLVRSYAERMPSDIATLEMARVERAGPDKIYFAFAGEPEPGKPHSYRIQGPDFVVEYLNIQQDSAGNPANHVHSAWRYIQGDFGLSMTATR